MKIKLKCNIDYFLNLFTVIVQSLATLLFIIIYFIPVNITIFIKV